ncbi:MAG: TauD/TfdA family dioxygenase [Chloroflexi bacterium]|nr:TauD/TfdA family dioxygenase [Ktedonobacteraceae bacterium]MBV9707872.1 TauD/TfdA family dioxygenase [Chloroflexota bacterium]
MTTVFETFYVDVTHSDREKHLVHGLEKDGFVTFDNIDSKENLMSLARMLGTVMRHRDSDVDGSTYLATSDGEIKDDGYLAFSSSYLPLHTDRSGIPDPPTLILLWCCRPANSGGSSLLADGKHIHHVLVEKFPHVLQTLATPNSAIFRGTDIPLLGSVFNTLENGNIYIRFRYDNLGYYSAPVSAILPTFLEVLNMHTISFPLAKGQGYIIQNGRWLHGRTSFQGKREMYRVLIKTDDETSVGKRVHLGFNPGC